MEWKKKKEKEKGKGKWVGLVLANYFPHKWAGFAGPARPTYVILDKLFTFLDLVPPWIEKNLFGGERMIFFEETHLAY